MTCLRRGCARPLKLPPRGPGRNLIRRRTQRQRPPPSSQKCGKKQSGKSGSGKSVVKKSVSETSGTTSSSTSGSTCASKTTCASKSAPLAKKAPDPEVVEDSDFDVQDLGEESDPDSDGDEDEEGGGDGVVKKKKERRLQLVIDRPIEDALVEWIQQHPELYNKAEADYRKTAAKKALWQSKADELKMSVEDLLCWYKSQRTRLGKILMKKSGQEAKIPTAREKWVLEKWSFLKNFITRQQGRVASSVSSLFPF